MTPQPPSAASAPAAPATPPALAPLLQALAPLTRRLNLHRFLWALTVVCALIAWNRGLALLWGLVAFLLAALGLSLGLAWRQTRGVGVTRNVPAHAEAGQPLALRYGLHAPGRRRFVTLFEDFLPPGQPAAFVPLLPRAMELDARLPALARGVYALGAVRVQSAWPLGLVAHSRRLALPPQELLVLPAMAPIARLPQRVAPASGGGALPSPQRGAQDDFAGVREYRHGDAMKTVHWPASARQRSRGQPWLVKTFERFDQPRVLIVLNRSLPAGAGFERMASLAASIARHACWEGWPVALYADDASPGWPLLRLAPHAESLYADLRPLATLAPARGGRAAYAATVDTALAAVPDAHLLVSFSAAGDAFIPTPAQRTRLAFVLDTQAAQAQRQTDADGWRIRFDPERHDLPAIAALLS